MAFLFRSKPKTDLVKTTKDLLANLLQGPSSIKTKNDTTTALAALKLALIGPEENDVDSEVTEKWVNALIKEDVLFLLTRCMGYTDINGFVTSQKILSFLIRWKPVDYPGSTDTPVVKYMVDTRPEIIYWLCHAYDTNPTTTNRLKTHSGKVLREAIKFESVTLAILYKQSYADVESPSTNGEEMNSSLNDEVLLWQFFEWIDKQTFEVAADCFQTFKEILTLHKQVAARFIMANFDLFFSKYHEKLVLSTSYVTKRQSIKLLGELLLDRANYEIMMKYVERGEYLKICMTLLKDDRKMVQYEGFHVFKVFVANPQKSDEVVKILLKNQSRLIRFLPTFLADRNDEDEQFRDEKNFLIRTVSVMADERDPYAFIERNAEGSQ
ncbi:hypothetical protein MMC26_003945 [Xylographa opegraphella]|nr:hypothetical protein [Xylographa opegraphella]